jgi:urease accessory protein
MKRAYEIRPAGCWQASAAIDCVVLDADQRTRRRSVLVSERGMRILLDFARPQNLRSGDALLLDDGSIVSVAGKPEQLVEIVAEEPAQLARFAWHLGNRHTDVQLVNGRLRIRRDHVLEAMLRGLGARLAPIEAPFDPEPGAYALPHDDSHAF